MKKKYDTTVARIAGNIMAGLVTLPVSGDPIETDMRNVRRAVALARLITNETFFSEADDDQPVSEQPSPRK